MPRRALAAVAIALLTIVLTAGCVDRGRSLDDADSGTTSGGQPGLRPYEVVQGSFDKLVAAGTARVRSQAETQVASQTFDVTGTGTVDFRQRAYDLTLDVPIVGSARAIGIENVVYVQSDRLSRELPGNPRWLRVDPARLQSSGSMAGAADNPFVRFAASTGDALPALALVKGAPEDTRVVGPDTVEGQAATHYTAELDVAQAKRYTTDPQLAAALDRYTKTVRSATVPADVWVDDQGRLVRLKLVFSTVFGKLGTGSTFSFFDIGAPIDPIAAPPPGQVTDLLDVLPG